MKPNFLVLFIFAFMGLTYASGDSRLEFSVKEVSVGKMSTNWVGWPKANVELELKNLTGDTLIFLPIVIMIIFIL